MVSTDVRPRSIALDKIRVSDEELNKARRHPYFSNMVAGLKTNGLIQPIIVNKDYIIVDGLLRFVAALALGWEEIPARVVGQTAKIVDLAPGSVVQITAKHSTAFHREYLGAHWMVHGDVHNVTVESFSANGYQARVKLGVTIGTITIRHLLLE